MLQKDLEVRAFITNFAGELLKRQKKTSMKQIITANKTPRPITVIVLAIVLAACSGDGSQMRAQLEELERQNRADSVMTNDSLAEHLVKYFDRHGTPNERMRAHYILGRTYADMGEAPAALEADLDAADCADTTTLDCDWAKLSRVYGQMSEIFYLQGLIEDNIYCLDKAILFGWKAGDTIQALNEQMYKVNSLLKNHQDDEALSLFDSIFPDCMCYGGKQFAARYCLLPIEVLLNRNDLKAAHSYLQLFESHSGYFDDSGNIESGRETYYYYRGDYYRRLCQADSAEFFFRKEIGSGLDFYNQNAGAQGLATLYKQTHQGDSAAKYALYSYDMLDSLYQQTTTWDVIQSKAMYDYSHHQAIANREHKRADQEKAQKNRLYVVLLFVSAIVLIAWFLLARKRRLEAERIRQLNQALSSAKREQQIVMKELDDLKAMNYDELISQKEQQRLDLQKYIAQLEGTSGKVSLRDFKESQIVKTFAEKSQFSKDHPVPNQAEWDMLEQQFRTDMPGLYRLFEDKGLSDLEFRTCLLLLLDYDEGTVAGLTQSSSQTINSAKARANQKLFNEKGAKTLHRALKKLI